MNLTATWAGGSRGSARGGLSVLSRHAAAISAVVVLATVALSLWMCWESRYSLQAQAFVGETEQARANTQALVRQFEFSIWRVGGAAALVGAASLASVLFIQGLWRARLFECLEQQERDCESQTIQLEAQLADARRARELAQSAQADLEAQVAALASAKASLQEALDKRTRAEKALTQKRQELESSKSVLELHVQARTQELQKLQRLYEMILNSAGEGICGLDMEGKTTFVNPTVAKITGLKLEELIGRKETEVFRIQGFDGKAPSESTACEGLFHRCDGSSVPVEFVRTPINEDGRAVGAVLVFKDITERKRVEETLSQKAAELARSNAELEQFAFVASHDLQEPLRKIQAFGDRLKGKCEGILPAEALDYLERMHSASARMRNLINDLLAFSRVIRSSEPFIAVDIGKVVREVLGDLEVRIEKSGAVVEFGSLATIEADPMQMRQLFQNLIGNALKFQPAGGKPVVRIASRAFNAPSGKEFCEITVQDNGIGFDEKYLDRIFAVFQRLHGRAEYEGTGVGLAVCRRIVDRHGGSISARSVPGKGATFSVMLPLSQIPAEEAA